MRYLIRRLRLLAIFWLVLGAPLHSMAASTPDEFCTGDPCIVFNAVTIDDLADVDFEGRTLDVRAKLDVGSGSVFISAGSIIIGPTGQLRGKGGQIDGGGSFMLIVDNDVELNSTLTGGAVLLTGADGGALDIFSTNGSLTGAGKINLGQTVSDGSGGEITVDVGGEVNLTGKILAEGGGLGCGGYIDVTAVGPVRIVPTAGQVDISGGDCDAGSLTILSGDAVTLGQVNGDGSGQGGFGGAIDVTAAGPIWLQGSVNLRGAGNTVFGGDGGSLDLDSFGVTASEVIVDGQIQLLGRGPDGCGGLADISADTVRIRNSLQVRGTGSESCGGGVDVFASELISITGTGAILGDVGRGGGSEFFLSSDGDIEIFGEVNAEGRNTDSSGGAIYIDATGAVTVGAEVTARSQSSAGFGGDIDIRGCTVTVNPLVKVRADEFMGTIFIGTGDLMTLRGEFTAGPVQGSIDLHYRNPAVLPDTAGATFNITPAETPDTTLLACPDVCGNGIFEPPNEQCDDGNTADGDCCSATCQFEPSGSACADDGNVCTAEFCDGLGTCTHPAVSGPCNDGNACTTGDTCSGGVCVGGAPPNCDDGNVCTNDFCNPLTGCATTPRNGVSCDDGSACTIADTCSGGSCLGGPPPNCNDGNECTDDSCNPATGCVNAANTAPCDDGNACTAGDTCGSGACQSGLPVNCNDGNACTDDSCNPASGCVNAPNSDPCNDGNACTTGDTCSSGSCVGGLPVECNDGNLCTDDSCNTETGCANTPNTNPCDDGSACTVGDTCSSGACQSGPPANCNDGDVCTDDSCNPASGCVNAPNSDPCNDGNACTTGDTCSSGSCVSGLPIECNDGNLCTDDSCNPASGCVNTPNSDPCDDGNACTLSDSCNGGSCVGGPPPNCSDGNTCTDDSCNPASGCVHTFNSAPCSDGNPCTTADTCSGGSCLGGPPPNCSDGNGCTDDSCNPLTGCVNTPNTNSCSDGDACTTGDTCGGGTCQGTSVDCSDGNICTADACVAGVCSHLPVADGGACDDSDVCTTGDSCAGGVCQGGAPLDCDDEDVCTTDSCNPATGCQSDQTPGCSDQDGDSLIDQEDECTTLSWTSFPMIPPNQHPLKAMILIKNLNKPAGEHELKVKGFFNPASSTPVIDPGANGIHAQLSDDTGTLYEVSVPGGAVGSSPCGSRDGWKTIVSGTGKTTWKYSNRTNALPPDCTPGSAQGLSSLFIKDMTKTKKAAYQYNLKAKRMAFTRLPEIPLTRIQFDIGLAAQPDPGTASEQAIAGQCAEQLIKEPIRSKSPKPFCKVKFSRGALKLISCKGF